MNCILLRYGEVGIKSWRKRPVFERHYIVAIKDALDKNGLDIIWGTINSYKNHTVLNGYFNSKRSNQTQFWLVQIKILRLYLDGFPSVVSVTHCLVGGHA